jgi:hypothetical protein
MGARHHLGRPIRSIDRVVSDLVGLHASDPVTVHLSAWARVIGFSTTDLEDALYERRSVVRMLGMRRTLFVVPVDVADVMDEACTRAVAVRERRRLVRMLEREGITEDGAAWLRPVERKTMQVLEEMGEAAATELSRRVPELRERITFGEGKGWGGQMGVSTRVLFLLAAEGRIVRARPRGSWVSGQYRWAPTDAWLGRPLKVLDHAAACGELLTRWLRAFGPGTETDIRWWTGWNARTANATLEAIGAVDVELDNGSTAFVLPYDLRRVSTPARWVRLLPGLDATVMGWKQRDWYLGPHASTLFDTNGNAGPTIIADGRVIGGWTQRKNGAVVIELLEKTDRTAWSLLKEERERLENWFAGTKIVPRFRTPLERRLHV